METPLELLLKNKKYLEIARLQDEVISRLYNINTKLTFHGGTSVWRCYGGKRFSYDLDLYIKNRNEIERLISNVRRYGLTVNEIKTRGGSRPIMYYNVSNYKASIALEFAQKRIMKSILATYIKTDGSQIDIFSLSPEAILSEKIEAYNSRRAIKDLYDIFILAHTVKLSETRSKIIKFMSEIKQPADENTLKYLIYNGPIPDTNELIEYIKRRYEIR